jgi:pimeloyl-ACP methyl ester carboxylesterase
MMPPFRFRSIQANGLDISYLDEGDGPAVLLLHGFPDIATTFLPLLEHLVPSGYRCVAPWLRGYWPTNTGTYYDEGTLLADAIALLQELELAPAFVIGHDWGADIAYGLATARPDLVRRVVAMAVPHTVSLRANRRRSYQQLKRSFYVYLFQVPGLAESLLPADDWAFIRRLWRDWSPGWNPPRDHLTAVIETLARPGVLTAALGYYRALFDPALRDPERRDLLDAVEAGPVAVPTLLLMGGNDGCVAPEMAEGAEQAFAASYRTEVLQGVGHFLHLERPDLVSELVRSWLGA